jgi:hypothetical protein
MSRRMSVRRGGGRHDPSGGIAAARMASGSVPGRSDQSGSHCRTAVSVSETVVPPKARRPVSISNITAPSDHTSVHARLPLEARQPPRIGGELTPEDLDRHVPSQPRVPRGVDLAHPAFAEPAEDSVRTKGRSDHGRLLGSATPRRRGSSQLAVRSRAQAGPPTPSGGTTSSEPSFRSPGSQEQPSDSTLADSTARGDEERLVASAPYLPRTGAATNGAVSATTPSPADGQTTHFRSVEIPDVESRDIEIDLGGTVLSGVVLEETTERPLPAAQLSFHGGSEVVSAETDASGRFQVDLAPGR